jgi:hypothetical protein
MISFSSPMHKQANGDYADGKKSWQYPQNNEWISSDEYAKFDCCMDRDDIEIEKEQLQNMSRKRSHYWCDHETDDRNRFPDAQLPVPLGCSCSSSQMQPSSLLMSEDPCALLAPASSLERPRIDFSIPHVDYSAASNWPDELARNSSSLKRTLAPPPAIRLCTFAICTIVLAKATMLLIDINNFTAACAALPAGRVDEWVAGIYRRVGAAAAAHGVTKVDRAGTAACAPPAPRAPCPAARGAARRRAGETRRTRAEWSNYVTQ